MDTQKEKCTSGKHKPRWLSRSAAGGQNDLQGSSKARDLQKTPPDPLAPPRLPSQEPLPPPGAARFAPPPLYFSTALSKLANSGVH